MPKKYTSMGLSTLHDNVFSLSLTLFNKFYEVHLDNLYMSAKFVYLYYTHNNWVKLQGVCQTRGKGIPKEVL